MAINLAKKYSDHISNMYYQESLLGGKTSKEWNWDGVKSVEIPHIQSVPLNDYTRKGSNRYGEMKDVQDTVQTLTLRRDRSFALVVDKGDNTEQMMIKNAGKVMAIENREQVVPEIDKYTLKEWLYGAGTVSGMAKPTKTSIVQAISDAMQVLDDNHIPQAGRYLYLTGEMYSLVRLSPEFLNIDSLGEKALEKGVVGELFGAKIVKVPTPYLPKNAYFLLTHKSAVLLPEKIRDAKIHEDPVGVSGAVLEGRYIYDAFVVGARSSGVYAAVAEGTACAAPTFVGGEGNATIATADGGTIYYTTDGSDPRYSDSAKAYTEAVTLAEGDVLKAYVKKDGMYPSAVAEFTL